MIAFNEDAGGDPRRDVPAPLLACTPSVKLVHVVLKHEGPLTQKQLRAETRLPARTVRHAIETLTDLDIVTEEFYPHDGRQRLYRLTGREQR